MPRHITLVSVSISLLALLPAAACAQQEKERAAPSKAYQALLDEYEKVDIPREFVDKFFDFAQQHAKQPEAVRALAWIATNLQYRTEAVRAIGLLQSDHLQSRRLSEVFGPVSLGLTPAAQRLLEAALEKSPHSDVRAQACFHLFELLDGQMRLAEVIKKQPSLRKRAAQYYGKPLTDRLVSLDAKKVEARKEKLCETLLKSFPKQPAPDGTMGEFAKRTLFAMRHLSVGKQAPDIAGGDVDGRKFKLSDYRGKVVMLSFWGHW